MKSADGRRVLTNMGHRRRRELAKRRELARKRGPIETVHRSIIES
jgi:hypothetical protein